MVFWTQIRIPNSDYASLEAAKISQQVVLFAADLQKLVTRRLVVADSAV